MASKACLTCSGSRTSQVLRPSVATVQPSLRSRSETAAPMPRVPPVTTAQPSDRTPPLARTPAASETLSGADMNALLPADHAGAPDEPGAEGDQRDGRARLQTAVSFGLP